MQSEVFDFLRENGIRYVLHEHDAVFTVEQSSRVCAHIPGMHCKNLFLRAKDGKFFLITMPAQERMDVKGLAHKLHVDKLSFAPAEDLKNLLGLEPGSVSPLGMINDRQKKVTLVVTKRVWAAPIVGFHPNDNRSTLEMAHEEFERLLRAMGCSWVVVDI